jgi:protein-S-isoprenylcysteine O-methyltransferase Ste14
MRAMLFGVSIAGWVALEAWLFARDRVAGVTDAGADRGSGPFLILVIAAAIAVDAGLARDGAGLRFRDGGLFAAGLACLWAGVALRLWAVLTLGRFFRLVVVVQSGHHVVRRGPYRLLRHPAYTGTLLSMTGLGLCLESWAGLAVIILLPLVGYARRISVEEGELRARLGSEYVAYSRATRRLVPFVW